MDGEILVHHDRVQNLDPVHDGPHANASVILCTMQLKAYFGTEYKRTKNKNGRNKNNIIF